MSLTCYIVLVCICLEGFRIALNTALTIIRVQIVKEQVKTVNVDVNKIQKKGTEVITRKHITQTSGDNKLALKMKFKKI